ncbi:cytochrome c oxidase subunit II [bacterium]|nr:cytochrome c oxidase subunit II [bacterium]NDA09412.1 cytochrome c oxidase subunit II [Verrucomicrobiota bacterium]
MSRFWRAGWVGLLGWIVAAGSTGWAEIREAGVWWLPRNVSHFGHEIDFMIYVILWLTGITGILVFSTMIYFIVKYRHRAGVGAIHSHGNNTLEVVWTTIPVFIFLALAIYGNEMWGRMRMQKPPADALQVAVVGEQFGWNVRYPGPDGKLGKMDSHKIGKDNPFGIDPNDPDGKDDFTTYNELVFPVGHPVQLHLGSKDVIHAFYVPEFRLYQDMVPGRVYDFVWFKADSTGHFQLACNQLCGQGHYKMFGKLSVVPEEEYQAWAKGKAPATIASSAPMPANTSVANR